MGLIRRGHASVLIFVAMWSITFMRNTPPIEILPQTQDPSFAVVRPIISHAAGENYLSRTPPENCRRTCARRDSVIFYAESTDGGLDDRIRVINAMSNLASFLCAELHLLPPSDLLQPYHNNNTRLSDDLEWSDFLRATRVGESDSPPFALRTTRRIMSDDGSESSSSSSHSLHIVTTDMWESLGDFRRVHDVSFRNETFSWEIRVSWWSAVTKRSGGLGSLGSIVDDLLHAPTAAEGGGQTTMSREEYLDMLPTEHRFPSIEPPFGTAFLADVSRGCTYVRIEYSTQIELMQREFEREIVGIVRRRRRSPRQSQNDHGDDDADDGDDSLVGLLHLRRGDTTHLCNTSPEKVRAYLECSLGPIVREHGLQHNLTLVMTSEEKDAGYRNAILGLAPQFGRHLTIVDGDEIARNVVDEAARSGRVRPSMARDANYVHFAVEAVLRRSDSASVVDFRLTRRRADCPDCDAAAYQALDPGAGYRFEGDRLLRTNTP